jgi:hypothetical protein
MLVQKAPELALAEVDHLFPHVPQRFGLVTNLARSGSSCLLAELANISTLGKFDRTPDLDT